MTEEIQDDLPSANSQNWREIGHRIHCWFMKKMGITVPSVPERVFLGLALAGEAGELANLVKKYWRDGPSEALEAEILKEMADVQGYLEHLAFSFDVELDDITADKTNELIDRWPQIWTEKVEVL